ncbi:EI24 domain-containing protein [Sulfurospirillum arcachonense]|uniref:EI24 domain-containing protein n=1 Tax=Sulfurospirillum arcachonense TaxID=57666 RepID=UPI00046A8B93|nr:EI24 domain-containing protein [Sulfurospirillum arcachonense]
MHEMTLTKATKDFFSQKFLFMSLTPFIIPILVLGAIFLYGSNELFVLLRDGSVSGDFSYINESEYPTFAYLLSFSVVHWIVMTLFVLLGSFGVVLFSLVIAVITVGLLTPLIVKNVREKNYSHVKPAKADSIIFSLWHIFKIFMKFLLLLLCSLPFLFIPLFNFMVFQLPFFYLFYRLMMYDLVSVGISDDAEKIIKENRVYLLIVMGIFFLLSLIPLLGLLLQVFFVVYLSHFILSKSQAIVSTSNNKIENI